MLAVAAGVAPLPAQPAASRPAAVAVQVTGRAAAENPDHVAAARLDAVQQAIQQAGGAQVKSHALVRFNELVGQFTYVRAQAVVSAMQPLGEGRVAGGVYLQPYRVEVKADALNRELVDEKIDVEFLYDLVLRPRIAVAITDEWNPGSDPRQPWQSESEQFSNQQVMAFFKARHPGFVFREIALLRASAAAEPDYVREARANSFDILFLGTTRTALRREATAPAGVGLGSASSGTPFGGQPDTLAKLQRIAPAALPRFHFSAQLDWRVINVGTAETILVLSGQRAPGTGDAGAADEIALASRLAKQALLDEKLPGLFRDLMQHWNRSALRESYTVVVRTAGAVSPLEIETRLRAAGGLAAESIRLEGAVPGRITFSGHASRSRSEVAHALAAAFAGRFALGAIRAGYIELEPVDGAQARTLTVVIGDISLTDAKTVQAALEAVPEIARVQRQSFAAGRVTLQLTSALGDEDVGMKVEQALPGRIQVTALNAGVIEARGTAAGR